MSRREIPEEKLNSFFGRLKNWALLRNADVYENFKRGGDCDLLVADLDEASKILIEELGPPILVARRSYLRSFFYPWGHLDLTDHYYWRGIQLLEGKALLDEKISASGFPLVSPVDEAITRLLGSLLWGGFIKERYSPEILSVYREESDRFRSRLATMLGVDATDVICGRLEDGKLESLVEEVLTIRKAVRSHFRQRSFLRYLEGRVRFTTAEVLLRVRDLLPILVLNVSSNDCEDFEAGWESAVSNLDQHCKSIEIKSTRLIWRTFAALLRNISFRARNGILVIVQKGTKNLRTPFWGKFTNCFVTQYSKEVGLEKAFDDYYAYCGSQLR